MQVFSTSPDFWNLKLDDMKWIGVFTKLWSQSLCDLASIGSLVEEKPDDHLLFTFRQDSVLDIF
jgi:hypothetical protein